MSEENGKKILSHGKIYLVGNVLQRCVSFVMLPIYTRCLTPSDYGTIELLSMVLDFVGIILGLRIGQAIFRFYAKYDKQKDKNEIITTAIYLVFLLNIVGVFLLFFTGDFITMLVFDDISQKQNLLLFSLTLLMQGFVEIPMLYIRAKQRPWLFVGCSVFKLSIQLSLNIVFVVVLNLHVEGVIYSAVISSGIMGLILAFFIAKECGFRFSVAKARELVSFSIPLMLTSMISFYITFGDRYFLKINSGLDEVGIYSLAYKFGFLLVFLVGAPFAAIWDSEKYTIAKQNNAKETFNNIFIYYSTVVIFVCIVLSVFIADLLVVMAAPEFLGAARIVPIILIAYMVNSLGDFLSLGILIKNKTWEMTYSTVIACFVITVGYLVLIPMFGAIGAAWATVFAFTTRVAWVYFRAKRLFDMGITWRYPASMLVLWGGIYSLSGLGHDFNLLSSLLLNSFLVVTVLILLLFTPVLPEKIRIQLRQVLRKPKRLFR